MSDAPPSGSTPLIFRIVGGPAGWRIIGADAVPMATLYLSRRLATEHAQEIVEVLKGYGQRAEVVVEDGCLAR